MDNLSIMHVLMFVAAVFIASLSQILLKISSEKKYSSHLREYLNVHVVSAYGMFFLSSVLTVIAYRGVELKAGPIIQSLNYIFVLFLGQIFLSEKITLKKAAGVALIVAGIVVFNL